MKRAKRYLLVLVALTIYLNIGWGVMTYYEKYICQHEAQTFWQKLWAGTNSFWTRCSVAPSPAEFFTATLVWLFFPLLALISWLFWLIHHALWLIFWGGAYKLLLQLINGFEVGYYLDNYPEATLIGLALLIMCWAFGARWMLEKHYDRKSANH